MNEIDLILTNPILFCTLIGIIGLMVGSFLNVVIYRLPIMMHQTWHKECAEFLEIESQEKENQFNLAIPQSHCPHCKSPVKFYQNIPVLSYLLLRGRCANCKTRISLRYPAIELFTGICSVAVAWKFGPTLTTAFALLLTWSLIALSGIDIDHQLLPDSIVLPMLWLGLFLSLFKTFTDSHSSIIGAIAGYLTLWTVFQLFKLITGKEGMGYGDFKLLSMFGAWLGWQFLPQIILVSSLVGAFFGISFILFFRHDKSVPIPFGPYLAAAGWIALILGNQVNTYYLNLIGL